jgi:adenylosuccinate lyase
MSISCLDNRYLDDVKPLLRVCDDFAYYRNRVFIELEYFKAFTNIQLVYNPFLDFKDCDYQRILEQEAILRHDVKAIEYFIKSLPEIQATGKSHLIHIGLTSQDICSPAFIICFDKSIDIILAKLSTLSNIINQQLIMHPDANCLMVGLTHGQPATPTSFKKEMMIYQYRLDRIFLELKNTHLDGYTVKFGGATGEWNAMQFARPSEQWSKWLDNFIQSLDKRGRYHRSQYTNQCDDYDSIIRILYILKRLLHILEHLRGNIWLYIHCGYLNQQAVSSEVGSSTMPNKVNPIDIENAKTAIEMAKRMIDGICDILTETSYQRDVSDSSALRNVSSLLGYCVIAINKITKGISRLTPNKEKIQKELEEHPEVVLEGIQTYLKLNCQMVNAYEILKDISRGKKDITLQDIHKVIDDLDILDKHKEKLKELKSTNYEGILKYIYNEKKILI